MDASLNGIRVREAKDPMDEVELRQLYAILESIRTSHPSMDDEDALEEAIDCGWLTQDEDGAVYVNEEVFR